jgi:hypothetical protein
MIKFLPTASCSTAEVRCCQQPLRLLHLRLNQLLVSMHGSGTQQRIVETGLPVHTWDGFLRLANVTSAEKVHQPFTRPQPEDVATIMYTSGTTGAQLQPVSSSLYTNLVYVCEREHIAWKVLAGGTSYFGPGGMLHVLDMSQMRAYATA